MSERDEGLVRVVGPWGLAASIVGVVVGGGIFAVPAALSACAGPWAPLAFVACAVVVGSVALCFAEGGSRVPTSGGPYGVIAAAFGPFAGTVSGNLLWFGDVLACGSIAAALGDAAASLAPASVQGPARAAVIVASVGGAAAVNARGVAHGVRLVGLTTALKLVPLAVFLVAGATALRAGALTAGPALSEGGVGRALILATFAFMGMESSLAASGEVALPSRSIPKALAIAMGTVTVAYVAIQLVAQGVLGADLARSRAPLADAMGRIHPGLRDLMLLGAAVSMAGWIATDVLGTPRVVFALARDGWLPRPLAAIHARSRAPHVAIVSYGALAIGLALTGTFGELAVLSTLATAPIYVGGCAAAWVLARRGVATAGTPLAFRGLTAAAVVGSAGMVATIALAARAEIEGLLALLAACSLAYVIVARRRAARPG